MFDKRAAKIWNMDETGIVLVTSQGSYWVGLVQNLCTVGQMEIRMNVV